MLFWLYVNDSPIKHPNLLQRTEIVALFNTFNRVSESVASIARFRTLYMQQHGLPMPSTPIPSTPPSQSAYQEEDPSPIQAYIAELFKDTHAILAADPPKDKNQDGSSSSWVEFPQGLSATLKEKILSFSRHPLGTFFSRNVKKVSGNHHSNQQRSQHHTQKKAKGSSK